VTAPEEDAPRVVRPYAVTGGRSRGSRAELPLEALVNAPPAGLHNDRLRFEHADVVRLCLPFQSLAEVSAHLRLPVGVARTIVCDLIDEGLVTITLPRHGTAGPDVDTLGKVLDGLLAL